MRIKTGRWKTYVKSLVYPMLKKRRCHAYCVSLPKSGTKSMAGVFARDYRASHEKESELLMQAVVDSAAGKLSDERRRRIIRGRDRRLWLEFDSSTLNYFILDVLVKEFPEAKFILTIRDPYPWLDSLINHVLGRGLSSEWAAFAQWWFKPENFRHGRAERALEERGLFPLDCYFSCWARHNSRVLDSVPAARLQTIRTEEIAAGLPRLAEFLSLPLESLDSSRAHIHRAVGRFEVLSEIDSDYLQERCRAHCESLLERFFPDSLRGSGAFSEARGAG